MTDLLAVAERCEREEPGRALDLEIFRIEAPDCVGDAMLAVDTAYHINSPLLRTLAGHEFYLAVPHYTGSLDEAVSLMPDGAEYTISTLYGVADVELPINSDAPQRARHKGCCVASAVCAAALRARAAKASRQAA